MNLKIKNKFLIIPLVVASTFGIEWKMIDYPAPRGNLPLTVDSLNQRIILFGGTSYIVNGRSYNDVW